MLDTQPVSGNTVHTHPENRAFFPALDGVRAVAFLLVFMHHYLKLEVGWVGVDIFFVLSGFLITGILYDTRDAPHRAKSFYIRRSLRIFPLYYLVTLAVVAVTPVVHWNWDWRWLAWPLYAGNLVLFVHQGPIDVATKNLYNGWLNSSSGVSLLIGHFWSLCVEEQFYLLWPWVVFQVRSRRVLIIIASTIVVAWPLLRHLATIYLPADRVAAEIVPHGTLFRLDTLMVGALVALIYRGPARKKLFQAADAGVWVAGAITGAALVAFVVHPSLLHNRSIKPFLFTIGFSVIALFAAILIVRCLPSDSIFARVLRHPVLRWIGRISYGAYVFHDMFHSFYAKLSERTHIPTALIGIVCTLALAWLSFRFFETKFLDLKDRLTA